MRYSSLSAEQRQRLQNIMDIIQHRSAYPSNLVDNLSVADILRLMDTTDDDIAVVEALEKRRARRLKSVFWRIFGK